MSIILYPLNSQYIEITGLKDVSTTPAAYINDGTLTATLFDSKNVAVVGATDIVGVYQAGTTGNWRFAVNAITFNPPVGAYSLVISGTALSGAKYIPTLAVKVKERTTGLE